MKILYSVVMIIIVSSAPGWAYSGGSGTSDEPYEIATVEDLINLGETAEDYDKQFVLTADIDLSGRTFNQALIAWDRDSEFNFRGKAFTGIFNGQGYTIHNI